MVSLVALLGMDFLLRIHCSHTKNQLLVADKAYNITVSPYYLHYVGKYVTQGSEGTGKGQLICPIGIYHY